MRSDNLKTHMKQHEKENYQKESICGSNFSSSTTSLQEDYKSVSDFSSISTYTYTPINEEFIIKTMEMNAVEYNKKLLLWGIVAKTVVEKKYHRIV